MRIEPTNSQKTLTNQAITKSLREFLRVQYTELRQSIPRRENIKKRQICMLNPKLFCCHVSNLHVGTWINSQFDVCQVGLIPVIQTSITSQFCKKKILFIIFKMFISKAFTLRKARLTILGAECSCGWQR